MTITNRSHLSIDVDIFLQHPFYLVIGQEDEELVGTQSYNMKMDESITLVVEFVRIEDEKRCLVVTGELKIDYRNHPNKVSQSYHRSLGFIHYF